MKIAGFDYRSGIYYYNVGEGMHRNWDDYRKYGFISAGQKTRFRDAIKGFHRGDIVAAYLKGHGFVGIGRITWQAKPVREVSINGKPLLSLNLSCKNMANNVDSDYLCEYVAGVEWIRAEDRSGAKWKSKDGIYTTTHVRASLDGQPDTIKYLEEAFALNLRELVE